jgi:hypothetical protein
MPTLYLSQSHPHNLKTKQIFTIYSPKTAEYIFLYLDNSLGQTNEELLKLARKLVPKENTKLVILFKNTEK